MQDAGRGVREESARSCCDAEACGEDPIYMRCIQGPLHRDDECTLERDMG